MITHEIRDKTADNHLRLEKSNILLPFSEQSLTRENYVLILQRFYGFFQPLESLLRTFPLENYLPDIASRRKSDSLLADLQQITGKDFAIPPLCWHLPQVTNLGQAMGCMYVMEGSTLGGKLIYKRVQQQLELDYTNGASFFYGYGAETGSKWKAFQQALTNFSEQYPTDQDIIAAANDTFACFRRWLDTE